MSLNDILKCQPWHVDDSMISPHLAKRMIFTLMAIFSVLCVSCTSTMQGAAGDAGPGAVLAKAWAAVQAEKAVTIESKSTGNGKFTTMISANKSSGSMKMIQRSRQLNISWDARYVENDFYFKANSMMLNLFVDFTAEASGKEANRWIVVERPQGGLALLADEMLMCGTTPLLKVHISKPKWVTNKRIGETNELAIKGSIRVIHNPTINTTVYLRSRFKPTNQNCQIY